MLYKLLQLNIYKGKYLNTLIKYINESDFDIICLQEVAGGGESFNGDNYVKLTQNVNYNASLGISWKIKSDPHAYFGNAIFYKKSLEVKNLKNFFMKDYEEIPVPNEKWDTRPRSSLFLDFVLNNKLITVGSAHLAWGPTPEDKDYKIEQAKKLLTYTKTIPNPLILCGDFNVPSKSEIIKSFSQIYEDQTTKKGLTNTLNLNNHKIKDSHPEGVTVDYIFTSKDLRVLNFNLIDNPELSDHFGLSLTFEV